MIQSPLMNRCTRPASTNKAATAEVPTLNTYIYHNDTVVNSHQYNRHGSITLMWCCIHFICTVFLYHCFFYISEETLCPPGTGGSDHGGGGGYQGGDGASHEGHDD